MDSTPQFPDQQTIDHLLEILRPVALEYGHSIATEECLAVCMLLVQGGYTRSSAILTYFGSPHPSSRFWAGKIRGSLEHYLIANTPAGGQRKISLPLDRRRGGEIHLTEEQAQLAMSVRPLEGLDSRPPAELWAELRELSDKPLQVPSLAPMKMMIPDLTLGALEEWFQGLKVQSLYYDTSKK